MPGGQGSALVGIVAEMRGRHPTDAASPTRGPAAHDSAAVDRASSTSIQVEDEPRTIDEPPPGPPILEPLQEISKADLKRFPALAVFPKSFAMEFDGRGGARYTAWAPPKGSLPARPPGSFTWHHIHFPREQHRLGHYLMEILLPLGIHCHDILPLVESGPFCGLHKDALLFRINSLGPISSNFTSKTAARLTPSSILTLSVYDLPRLAVLDTNCGQQEERVGPYAEGKLLDSLLQAGHRGHVDQAVPNDTPGVAMHLLLVLLDHLRDLTTSLELDLDSFEADMDTDYKLKRRLLEERRLSKMSLDIQRQLQTAMYMEEVLPTLRSKLSAKGWVDADDLEDLEEFQKRLRSKKERIGIMMNRISALQTSLRDWQSSLTNDTLFYLTVATVLTIPLTVITGAFGMNVTGVPFVTDNPGHGFRNVCLISLGVVVFLSVLFAIPPAKDWLMRRYRKRTVRQKWKVASSKVLEGVRTGSVIVGGSGMMATPMNATNKSAVDGKLPMRRKSLWDNVI